MQPQDSSFDEESKLVTDKPNPESLPSAPKPSFNLMFHRTRIRQKIGFGYALAIGIAIVGTTLGQLVGEKFYANQAREQQKLAYEEVILLSNLKIAVLETRSHQQDLIFVLENKKLFEQEHLHFKGRFDNFKQLYSQLKLYAVNHAKDNADIADLQKWLASYDSKVEAYNQQLEKVAEPIHQTQLQPATIPAAKALLLKFNNSELARQFESFSHDLTELVELAHREEEAAEAALEQAEVLRYKITLASLMLSVASAIAMAFYTSRAIARPLEAVTLVAQQATEKANFTLQAPVTTRDEVGVLATSFNSLIQRVAKYTQELERSRQTLERRVEERTKELWRKNEQLEEAHADLQQLNVELLSQARDLNQALQNLQQTQAQLIQTEKMSSLRLMVAGMTHEINGSVNFIYGNLDNVNTYVRDLLDIVSLYQQRYPNDKLAQDQVEAIELEFLSDDLPKILSSMQSGADHIRKIVWCLRNFSRLDEAEIKLSNIHEGIDNTLLILNHRLKNGIEISKNYGNLPLINCYPAQINQVFWNIINNAIDALIELPHQQIKQIVISTEFCQQNNLVKVRVRDNGPGIPLEIQGKLFDPFFTTKPVGKGTGLGLTICYQIMENHKGKIEVISQPGQGAEFTIAIAYV